MFHPLTKSLLPHFRRLLYQSIGYQKALQVSTKSKQMRICKPRTIFDEDPRRISMLVVCTSWLLVPHGIQHLTGWLQVHCSNILSRSWWEHDMLRLLFEHSSLLLLCWHLSQIFSWLLNLTWSHTLRENAMPQSFFKDKAAPLKSDGAQSAPNSLFIPSSTWGESELQTTTSKNTRSLLLINSSQPPLLHRPISPRLLVFRRAIIG